MKDPKHYEALHEAISAYNAEYNCTMRYWGELLGFAYKNAGAQFAGRLNPHNPEKSFNSTQMTIIIGELDDRSRRLYFDRYLAQWGLETAIVGRVVDVRLPDVVLHQMSDRAMVESSEAFQACKDALADGTLTDDELDHIIKEATEAKEASRRIAEAATNEKHAREVM